MHKIIYKINFDFLYYSSLALPVVFILWGCFSDGFLFTLDSQFTPAYNIHNLDLSYDLAVVKYLLYFLANIIHPKILQILYFATCLYLPAAISFSFLKKYVSKPAAFAASVFMICNPFVYERLVAGHLHIIFVLGLIIPYVHFLVSKKARARNLFLILIFLIASIISPHAIWYMLIPLGLNLLVSIKEKDVDWKPLISFLLIALIEYLVINFKILDSAISMNSAFFSNSIFSLFVLEGMWTEREGIVEKIFSVGTIPVLISWFLLYCIFGYGLSFVFKLKSVKFKLFSLLIVSGLIGFFLSALSIKEFSFLYEKLFLIPGFGVMREGHKWLGLYLVSFVGVCALGIDSLLRILKLKYLVVGCCLLIIVITSYKIFFLAHGQIKVEEYPYSWDLLESTAIKNPNARILVLPWQGYAEFEFLSGDYIADPTRLYFSNPVISARFPDNMNYLNECDIQDHSFCINYADSKEKWSKFLEGNSIEYIVINNTQGKTGNIQQFIENKLKYSLKIEENGNFVYFLIKK